MPFSILLLGATGTIGLKISKELALQKDQFSRAGFLTPMADAGPEKEAKYAAIELERIVGSLSDPQSYEGFDIVVSAVGDALCGKQKDYIDAAFAGGVKHFYPGECQANIKGHLPL